MAKSTTPLKKAAAGAEDDPEYKSVSFLIDLPNKKKLLGKWFHTTRKGSDWKKYVLLADKVLEVFHKRVDPNKLKSKAAVLTTLADKYEDGTTVYDSDELLETVTATTAVTSGDPIVCLVPLIKLMTEHLARIATSSETLLEEQNHKANIAIVKGSGKTTKEIELSKMSARSRKKMVAARKRVEKAEKVKKAALKKKGSGKRRLVVVEEDDEDEDADQAEGEESLLTIGLMVMSLLPLWNCSERWSACKEDSIQTYCYLSKCLF
ncbi:UNVERIFIED_CONTAM: hypothetical protein HDU68_003983 [Siphonaria sp. JEL0065]|nr:hypothetical protein HDU68_003983 [Siphonaria sp. JEL0065]